MTNPYAYWQNALAGVFAAVHDGHPQPGFYKLRRHKEAPWEPVAIWHDADAATGIAVAVGAAYEARDPGQTWLSCAKYPVTEEAYRHACEHGSWPGDPTPEEPRGIGDNQPPDTVSGRVAAAAEKAEAWLKRVAKIETEADANEAGNMKAELIALAKEADGERDKEKRPHLEAGRSIDEKWRLIIAKPQSLAKRLLDLLTPWMNQQSEIKKAAAAEAIATGAEPARVDTKVRVGGARGRAVHMRTEKSAEIVDIMAALTFLKAHPDIIAVVQRIANKMAKDNAPMPGCKIVESKRAA